MQPSGDFEQKAPESGNNDGQEQQQPQQVVFRSPIQIGIGLQKLGSVRATRLLEILAAAQYTDDGLAPAVSEQLQTIGVEIKSESRSGAEKLVGLIQKRAPQTFPSSAAQAEQAKRIELNNRQQEVRLQLIKLAHTGQHAPLMNGGRCSRRGKPSDAAVVAKDICHVIPKDLSARPKRMYMVCTASDSVGEDVALQLIQDMLLVAQAEGFQMHVTAHNVSKDTGKTLTQLAGNHLVICPLDQGLFSCWAEDSGEINADHIRVPARINKNDVPKLEQAIRVDREKRGYRAGIQELDYPEVVRAINRIGISVAEDGKQAEKAALATVLERKLVHHQSHIEGGNLLIGTDAGGRLFALVGKDSVAATRAHLAGADKELATASVDQQDDHVRKVIGQDLNLPAERVFFVEQPGQFHLDMGVLLLGNGIVAVNDSRQVLQLTQSWLAEYAAQLVKQQICTPAEMDQELKRESAKLAKGLQEMARCEAATVRDIVRASEVIAQTGGKGLKVLRVPGAYPNSLITSQMNFLNGEIGTSGTGTGYLITNGGSDRRAELAIADAYLDAQPALKTIYFVSSGASAASLEKGGGIGCRTKSGTG